MTTEEKRMAIARVYPTSKSWHKKVADMCESQVIAIYLSFEKAGTFRKGPKNCKPFQGKGDRKNEIKQLSVFDILKEKRK